MANRYTFSFDTVTAGKFVEVGKNTVNLKSRLRRISQIQSENNTNSSLQGIQQIASDNVITPEEKKLLADEWKHISAAYSSTVATITELGVNPEEFESFKTSYRTLESMMNAILADMNSNYTTDGRLDLAIRAYESATTILQNWVNAYQNSLTADISSYRLDVESSPVSPTLEDTIKFKAVIYIDGKDSTEEMMDSYRDPSTGLCPDLFQWSVSGTKNDSALIEEIAGKREFSVHASDLSGDIIKVYFASNLNVG